MSNLFISKNAVSSLLIVFIFANVIFLSFYQLSESPVTWTDEGLIIQTSANLVGQGVYGFQIAPEHIISPSFISTSYPITFPIALSFYLFGTSLFNARVVMALFILALIALVWFSLRKGSKEHLLWTLVLLVSFPPLYGQGKNVLGEVPGLVFFLMSAYFLSKLEQGHATKKTLLSIGFFAGLCIATKPIFILVLPGFLLSFFILYKKNKLQVAELLLVAVSLLAPVGIWIFVQFFGTDTLSSVMGYYSNPHSLDIFSAILLNLKDFLTNFRTLFAGGVFLLWSFVLLRTYLQKIHIKTYEVYLYTFSFLVFMNYFRNPPYYRYFFLAEVLGLLFLVPNLFNLVGLSKLWKVLVRGGLLALISIQFYQLALGSWVAGSYGSHRTQVMQETLSSLSSSSPIFIYQAPEAIVFLKTYNYYQYFSGTKTTEFGAENLSLLTQGKEFTIVTKKDLISLHPELFSHYHITKEFDRYVLLSK